MKRPRRPLHVPDPLVAAAEAKPQHHRCRRRNVHHKPDNGYSFGPRVPRRTSIEPQPVPPAYIHRVAEAILHGQRLMLVYEDYRGGVTKRHIVPKHWVEPGDRFTAHCELRGEDRDFRVHRFLDCQNAPPADQPASITDDFIRVNS